MGSERITIQGISRLFLNNGPHTSLISRVAACEYVSHKARQQYCQPLAYFCRILFRIRGCLVSL